MRGGCRWWYYRHRGVHWRCYPPYRGDPHCRRSGDQRHRHGIAHTDAECRGNKIKYACALTQLAGADETIKVPSVGDRAPRDLSRQALAEVVEPRYEELFTLVQSELRRSGFEDLVPAGIVITGGSSTMEGVVELAEEIFHMPVRLACP